MIKSNRNFENYDRKHSLNFEGVGSNKTITESVCLENGPKFSCVLGGSI